MLASALVGLSPLLCAAPTVASESRARAAGPGARLRPGPWQLLRRGQYERVIEAAPHALSGARRPTPASLALVRAAARAELALGRARAARLRLERATVAAPEDLPLRADLLRVAQALGDDLQVRLLLDLFAESWTDGRASAASPAELTAMAEALRAGNRFHEANDLLRRAARASPSDPEPHVAWGDLLLEKHAADDAERCFRDALLLDAQHPDALVGLARVLLERAYDREGALDLARRALAENPRHAGALALAGTLALDAGQGAEVRLLLRRLRATDPTSPDAAWLEAGLAVLEDAPGASAGSWLDGRPDRQQATLLAEVAEALIRHRRYSDAKAQAERCVRLAPGHARCLSILGTTLLRLGEEDRGLAMLRRAFAADPFDTRTFNQLELFDRTIAREYVVHAAGPLRFRVEPATLPALTQVVAPFLRAIYHRYVERYGIEPGGPITIELYRRPADFAIRTVGLPMLDVEAVCFGPVITALAPTEGGGSWGMILAHELAHSFALALGRERIPRWFTEGLAELETAQLEPSWTRREHTAVWAAWRRGELPRLGDMATLFLRARTPEQAVTAYLYSAQALTFLDARFGFAAIRAALADFAVGRTSSEVLERLAGMPLPALEDAFDRYLRERYAGLEAQFLPSVTELVPREAAERAARRRGASAADLARAGLAALEARETPAARQWLRLARERLAGARPPGPAADATADAALVGFLEAVIADREHDPARARAALTPLLDGARDGYDLRTRLGLAAVELGDLAEAERHLRRATELVPDELEAWVYLARLYERLDRPRDRLAAQAQAFLLDPQSARLGKETVYLAARLGLPDQVAALAPLVVFIDPADADVHAAHGRALRALGRLDEAIAALERATHFAPAPARELHRALAELYRERGQAARAREHERLAGPGSAPAPDAPP